MREGSEGRGKGVRREPMEERRRKGQGRKEETEGTGEMHEGVREGGVFVMCACESASTRSKRVHEGFDSKRDGENKRKKEYKNISGIKTTKGRKKTEGQLKKKSEQKG